MREEARHGRRDPIRDPRDGLAVLRSKAEGRDASEKDIEDAEGALHDRDARRVAEIREHVKGMMQRS